MQQATGTHPKFHQGHAGDRRTITALPASAWWALRTALKALAPVWVPALLYVALVAAWLGMRMVAGKSMTEIVLNLLMFMAAVAPVFVIWRLAVYARRGFPPGPLRQLLQDFMSIMGNPARLLMLGILFPAFYLFLQAFSVFKGNIAFVHPFAWDSFLMETDRWLHGGRQPWQWLFPLLQSVPATFVVNFIYNLWFFVAVGSLLWAVGQKRPKAAALRFLVAFMLVWGVGGSLMALIFSSAGPAYFGRLGLGADPYAPLMTHLKQVAQVVPVWALDTQEALWKGYLAHDISLAGISAFPSMHNAQATLVALLLWRQGGWQRHLGLLFAIMIAIGSVWLGWHYAVDAYAGIAIAIISWWLAGHYVRWVMHRPVMRQLARLQARIDSQRQRKLS